MTIKEIQVEGLFGMFNHTIPLNEEGLTIIYGINGIGKTTIFRMLELLFKGDFVALSEIPFDCLTVEVDDEYFFKVEKKVKKKIDNKEYRGMIFSHYSMNFFEEFFFNYDENDLGIKIKKNYPNQFELDGDDIKFFFFHVVNGKKKRIWRGEFLDFFPNFVPNDLKVQLSSTHIYSQNNEENHLADFVSKLKTLKILNIASQRLLTIQKIEAKNRSYSPLEERVKVLEESGIYSSFGLNKWAQVSFSNRQQEIQEQEIFNVVNTIQQVSNNISKIVKNKHEAYQELSEKLELSLGKRLIEKKVNVQFTVEELKNELAFVENKLADLRGVGLMEGQEIEKIEIDDKIDPLAKAVIAVNIQDLKQKLTIFDELYEELKLFQTIINERRFSYKKMYVSEDEGLIFKNYKDVLITSDELSSGEKHELIVLYQLIFAVPENALIFIDEPEISLHISWQKEFVNDMLEIIKLRNINIVTATHSPSIINGHWDLTVSLKGLEEEAYA